MDGSFVEMAQTALKHGTDDEKDANINFTEKTALF
jgi:hypothetical protein